MKIRRLVLVVLLALCGISASLLAVGRDAEASTTTPPGFRLVEVKKAGFEIAVPEGWVTLDLTRKPLAYYVKALRKKYPNVANFFGSDAFTDDTGLPYTDLFAMDPSDSTPTPENIRIEHFRQPAQPLSDQKKDIRSVLEKLGGENVEVGEVEVAGRPGLVASVVFSSHGPDPTHQTHYFVKVGGVQHIVVFTTRQDARQDPAMQTMIQSLRLRRS